ncbi:ribonuclease H2 subunit C [Aplysia californica]|uniref:Ribonuclease H2 subunit C n=1 Tax=Aplysia californica TaxID=6500 RepID=A0ABM0JSJ3_APLCA|nr:ribonuclease H2 subunit C [Aplysia californica]XP_012943410.1 ribonuclease H2 subunit C [Aplysia californica]
MATIIDTNSLGSAKEATCHFMPCTIDHDGEAKVSGFFSQTFSSDSSNGMTASFRGRPLNGVKIDLPTGYTGYVLQEPRAQSTEEEDRHLVVTDTFKKFSAWNLDKKPTSDDIVQRAMQWVDIADAIHRPVAASSEDSSQDDSQRSLKGH